jgi:hypothetical protein
VTDHFIAGASQLDPLQKDTIFHALASYRRANLSYDVAQQNGVLVIEGLLRDGVAPEIPAPIFPPLRKRGVEPLAH